MSDILLEEQIREINRKLDLILDDAQSSDKTGKP